MWRERASARTVQQMERTKKGPHQQGFVHLRPARHIQQLLAASMSAPPPAAPGCDHGWIWAGRSRGDASRPGGGPQPAADEPLGDWQQIAGPAAGQELADRFELVSAA